MPKCTNLSCLEVVTSNTPDAQSIEKFHACMDRTCGKFQNVEDTFLHYVLQMAQQSLDPETYGGFLKAYNALISVRKLHLKKID